MTDTVNEVSGSSPTVLALHGQPGTGRDFTPVVRALQGRYRVLTPDRPGWGSRSGEPAGGFSAGADDAAALLDREGAERAVVIGFSWGGGVALELARRYSDRVDGLVLAASVGPGEPTPVDRVLALPVAGRAICAAGLGFTQLVLGRRVLRRFLCRGIDGVEPSHLRRFADGCFGSGVLDSFMVEQRALVDELPGVLGGLGDIAVPTIVLTGDRDRLIAAGSARGLAEQIPGAELRMVAGAGHFLVLAGADALADAVTDLAERAALSAR
jgi:pimeloyl-ACP methyl ester carboxylesterase